MVILKVRKVVRPFHSHLSGLKSDKPGRVLAFSDPVWQCVEITEVSPSFPIWKGLKAILEWKKRYQN